MLDQMRFQARLQGIDPDEEAEEGVQGRKKQNDVLFRDPKDYESMSDEERKHETEKLMKKFGGLFNKGLKDK